MASPLLFHTRWHCFSTQAQAPLAQPFYCSHTSASALASVLVHCCCTGVSPSNYTRPVHTAPYMTAPADLCQCPCACASSPHTDTDYWHLHNARPDFPVWHYLYEGKKPENKAFPPTVWDSSEVTYGASFYSLPPCNIQSIFELLIKSCFRLP